MIYDFFDSQQTKFWCSKDIEIQKPCGEQGFLGITKYKHK